MKRKYIFSKSIRNTAQLIGNRSHDDTERWLRNRLQSATQFVQRLDLDHILVGHEGCVNSLEWNATGSLLASASDDNHVMIWDPFRRKKLADLATAHQGNIFSVKFLPKSGDSIVATGAADNRVLVYDMVALDVPLFSCRCHSMRVKRLATAPENPHLLWSSAEDGTVLQFDIREPHTCRGDDSVLLINLCNYIGSHSEVKSIAINQRRPEQLAVGANDPYARLYDRRMLSLSKIKYKFEDNMNPLCVVMPTLESAIKPDAAKYYSPGQFSKHREMTTLLHKTITHLSFSPDGTELLVNLGGEQIYLYDINDARPPEYLQLPPFDSQNPPVPVNKTRSAAVESLKRNGNIFLENERYFAAINEYTLAMALDPDYPALYLNRGTAYMRRNWYGDMYAALRDCRQALQLDPTYVKAQFRMARALNELGHVKEANQCLDELKRRFPDMYSTQNKGILLLNKDIALQSERNEEQDNESTRAAVPDSEHNWRKCSGDYKERFVGHCNTTTDIKEANFFGNDANFIIAGSDDGNFFIWERPSNMIHRIIKGDSAIVNCVQPHPSVCMLATSGIDQEIRLWTPQPDEDENGIKATSELFDGVVWRNQERMQADPFNSSVATSCRTS